ncbi:O-Glycosyl hydrolase family 30 [compost metagenome]
MYNLRQMNTTARSQAMNQMFSSTGLGLNVVRVAFGSPDFTNTSFYTYDDLVSGTDPNLTNFSIQKDIDNGNIDIIKQALQINPNIKVFASVWSPPAWMKDNNSLIGGNFLTTYTDTYAKYLRRAIQAYEAQGIPIYAVTIANEPDYCTNTYPQMCMTGDQIKGVINSLKTELTANSLSTKIWAGEADSLHDNLLDSASLDATTWAKVGIRTPVKYMFLPGG